MPRRVGLRHAALLVQEVHQGPPRLRHDRIETKGLVPGGLGQVVTALLVPGLPLEEPHPRGLLGPRGRTAARCSSATLRPRLGRLGGELAHQQMRGGVVGMRPEIDLQQLHRPAELPRPRQGADRFEAGSRPLRPKHAERGHPDHPDHHSSQDHDQEDRPVPRRTCGRRVLMACGSSVVPGPRRRSSRAIGSRFPAIQNNPEGPCPFRSAPVIRMKDRRPQRIAAFTAVARPADGDSAGRGRLSRSSLISCWT